MMTTRLVRVIVASLVLAASVLVSAEPAGAQAEPSPSQWAQLRHCESTGNYGINTGNGYFGAYQFDQRTWQSVGGVGLPSNASPAEQDLRALLLWRSRGSQPWPVCGRFLNPPAGTAQPAAPVFVLPAIPLPTGNLDLVWTQEGSPALYAAGWCDGTDVHVYVDGQLERATQPTGPRPDVGPGSTAGWRILTLAAPGVHHVQAWCIGVGGTTDLGEWWGSIAAPDRVIVGVRKR